jgi:hypothetical protein
MLLLSESTKVKTTLLKPDGTEDPEETFRTTEENVCKYMETLTDTGDMLSSTIATIISVKPGTLTKEDHFIEDIHTEMELSSKSEPNLEAEDLSSGTTILDQTNGT